MTGRRVCERLYISFIVARSFWFWERWLKTKEWKRCMIELGNSIRQASQYLEHEALEPMSRLELEDALPKIEKWYLERGGE